MGPCIKNIAQLDENNVVLQVIVVHNNELVASKESTVNDDGSVSVSVLESEAKGIAFCQSLFGSDTKWVQTSYNGNFRGKYAGIGDTYDAETNEFIAPVVEAISSADIPALTTADISSLG